MFRQFILDKEKYDNILTNDFYYECVGYSLYPILFVEKLQPREKYKKLRLDFDEYLFKYKFTIYNF